MEPKYLVMVTAMNNNKYYRMIPQPDGTTWVAEYGRIGQSCQKATYPASDFDKKYREKIRKGYVDQTDLHASMKKVVTKAPAEEDAAPITDREVAELVEMMLAWARKEIAANYTISYNDVTKAAVKIAQGLIDKMATLKSTSAFNKTLIDLFNTIPRSMGEVSSYLASDSSDFAYILQREQSLLDTMAGQIPDEEEEEITENTPKKRGRKTQKTILDKNKLEITLCTDEQAESVQKHLDRYTKQKFVRVWRVKNATTYAAFEKYCKKHNIDKNGIKFYYHGSRNENDWNIVKQGLKLHPSQAVIRTGAMFGHGHYFANVADKSVGYTSLTNSRWANGSSKNTLLFVFRVAEGNAYNLDRFSSEVSRWTEADCRKAGYDSVHAHAGADLKRDEIIVYNDAACTIEYIIELKADY